ncbi:MAG: exosortase K, partial [Acidobacteriota bacterium]
MNARLNLKNLLQLSTIFAIAFALKSFYSTASVNDLRWILAPTASLVELITSTHLEFESQAGYISSDHTFLIAASCAGVNFLIISFLMLSLAEFSRKGHIAWRVIPFAALASYAATLTANTVRIVIALWMHDEKLTTAWLDADGLHRLEGIVVYFGFLVLLFFARERAAMRKFGHVKYLL